MARLGRYFVEGLPQHVVLRGNNRQPIFASGRDYADFREILVEAAQHYGLRVHAYVWMPNHVHILGTPRDPQSLPRTIQTAGRRYVRLFNLRYRRTGTLWEGRYRAVPVQIEDYLFRCMRYIEENPVRAGMVIRCEDYPHSSYHRNAMGQHGPASAWLAPHALYEALAEAPERRCSAYRALFEHPLSSEALEFIRASTRSGWAIGDSSFHKRIERLSGRRASPLMRGPQPGIPKPNLSTLTPISILGGMT